MIELETEEILLREFNINDVKDMYEFKSDAKVTQYLPFEPYNCIQDAMNQIENFIDEYKKGNCYTWAIIWKQTNKVVGQIDLDKVDTKNNKVEIGYMLNKSFWNKGIMTSAIPKVLKFAFEYLNINKVEAQCEVENSASARVLEKAGMKLEGVLRQDRYRKGRYVDRKYYGSLREDFIR